MVLQAEAYTLEDDHDRDWNGGQRHLHRTLRVPRILPRPAGQDERLWEEDSGLTLREGLAWRTTAIAQYIHHGRYESPVHSLDDSIAVMRTIDEVRGWVASGLGTAGGPVWPQGFRPRTR